MGEKSPSKNREFWKFFAISGQDCGRKRSTRGYNEGIFELQISSSFQKTLVQCSTRLKIFSHFQAEKKHSHQDTWWNENELWAKKENYMKVTKKNVDVIKLEWRFLEIATNGLRKHLTFFLLLMFWIIWASFLGKAGRILANRAHLLAGNWPRVLKTLVGSPCMKNGRGIAFGKSHF